MKKLGLLLIGITVVTSLMAQDSRESVFKKLDYRLEGEVRKETIHNAFLSVYSPSRDFEYHLAKGAFKDSMEVTTAHPYYTASVGKTFTATAIGMLVDQGKIKFDDPISKYLPDAIMDGLHVLNEVDYRDSITVSHLLQHTSGMADYFERQTIDGAPSMFDLIMTQPDRFWESEQLITYSKAHFKPSFAPGVGYYYTDTEYVLLGMIIEEISEMTFNEFLAKNIFVPLDMNHTYLNRRSEASQPTLRMAEMYASDYEISSFESLSADWSGGAVVSTGKDLITFQEALLKGKLVSEETLNEMQQWVGETNGMEYGYGLRKINFKELSSSLPNWEVIVLLPGEVPKAKPAIPPTLSFPATSPVL